MAAALAAARTPQKLANHQVGPREPDRVLPCFYAAPAGRSLYPGPAAAVPAPGRLGPGATATATRHHAALRPHGVRAGPPPAPQRRLHCGGQGSGP